MKPCPSDHDWLAFLGAQLEEPARHAAATHLDQCAECQSRVDRLVRSADSKFMPPPPMQADRGGHADHLGNQVTRAEGDPAAEPSERLPDVPGYALLGKLGSGGMGVVYKARHLKLGRVVALKMIGAGLDRHAESLARFRAEAEAAAQLQHPNIVQIFEIGEHGAHSFLALEYCEGGNLASHLKGQPADPLEAARWTLQIAQAVAAAHERKIIHRDLKPANVLLTESGTLKLTDFGLAKKLDEPGLTQTGMVMGTPSYMAPEQATGGIKEVSRATDVYGLGAILYQMLVGSPPFRGATTLEVLDQVRTQEPVSPRRLRPKVPRDLETICLKCLHKEPNKRYASAGELADDVQRFLNHEPIHGRPTGSLERVWRWCKRNPTPALQASVIGLLLVVGSLVSWVLTAKLLWTSQQLEHQLEEARKSKQEARKAQLKSEWQLYATQISVSNAAYEDNDVELAYKILEDTREDFRGWEYKYLRALFNKNQKTLTHAAPVGHAAFSVDGKWIVSGCEDGDVVVWDATSLREVAKLRGHQGHVHCVCFSVDGTRLFSASEDRTVKVWDFATRREIDSLPHLFPVRAVAVSADGKWIVSGMARGLVENEAQETATAATVTIWSAQTFEYHHVLTHGRAVPAIAFSSDSKRFVTGSDEGTVIVWDAAAGVAIGKSFSADAYGVESVAFSPDGERLLTGGSDRRVKMWNSETGAFLREFPGHKGPVKSVAFSLDPDGQRIVSSSVDGTVKVWSAILGMELHTLKGHTGAVVAAALAADGNRIVSASADRTVKLWDVSKNPRQEPTKVKSLALCGAGRWIVADAPGAELEIWDANTNAKIGLLKGKTNGVRCACFSDCGTYIVCGGRRPPEAPNDFDTERGVVKIWNAATGDEVGPLEEHAREVVCVAFSPDNKRIAYGCVDGVVKICAADSRKVVAEFKVHKLGIRCLAFSRDGKKIVSGAGSLGERSQVKIWNAENGAEIRDFGDHDPGIHCVAFGARSDWIAVGSSASIIKIYDANEGSLLRDLAGHTKGVLCIALSEDGKRIATGGADRTVRVWDAASGFETMTLKGHTAPVTSVHFSADGQRIFSSASSAISGGAQAFVWNATLP